LRQGEASARVNDVIEREADDEVLHVLDNPLAVGEAAAEIDYVAANTWPNELRASFLAQTAE